MVRRHSISVEVLDCGYPSSRATSITVAGARLVANSSKISSTLFADLTVGSGRLMSFMNTQWFGQIVPITLLTV
jgi:hypothetical protein